MGPALETLHFTTIAIDGRAVLIEGPSGAGKSDLALRLIDRGAALVSDDYTELRAIDGALFASAPQTIAGRIEVRGIGILTLPHLDSAPVALLVRLTDRPERLPPVDEGTTIAGIAVAMIAIDPRPASAPIKVELALRHLLGGAA